MILFTKPKTCSDVVTSDQKLTSVWLVYTQPLDSDHSDRQGHSGQEKIRQQCGVVEETGVKVMSSASRRTEEWSVEKD